MSATQLHYYVTLGQVDPGTWRELLALHGDPTTIMLLRGDTAHWGPDA